jgi:hypothetical protein
MAKGPQTDVLIGLASQMHNIIPQRFFHERNIAPCFIGYDFCQTLVDVLRNNSLPSYFSPRTRRMALDMTLTMLNYFSPYNEKYRAILKDVGMVDALLEVESTPSDVESYKPFSGTVGVVAESGSPLHELVGKAKCLLIDSAPLQAPEEVL